MKLGIIGSGSWGKALASIYSRDFEVQVFSKDSDKSSLKNCEHIFIVVPVQALRELFQDIRNFIQPSSCLIICSKGLEINTGKLPGELVADYFPENKIAILSGPNFSSEVEKGMPAVTSFAMRDKGLVHKMSALLSMEKFKLIPTKDFYTAQIFGALKNVLAILVGFGKGVGFGENEIAALITQGIKEISALAEKKEGRKNIDIATPGCIGDLILTCTSDTSRNTRFGLKLAQYYGREIERESLKTLEETVEGNFTSQALINVDLTSCPLLKFSGYVMADGLEANKSLVLEKFREIIFK